MLWNLTSQTEMELAALSYFQVNSETLTPNRMNPLAKKLPVVYHLAKMEMAA
jgi:hypothetical protein